ncbi:hypothetical protein RvY_06551 [Ramazzottius varieornatus]|uniref:HTH CENPB-type domain-containing protein n=1 Tax=Ramazzottius varieornatus TaxID=947166 RepID=A0A1D1V7N8_RAMVA|nr:hypothetical protein RvY_06551 [Ramazzottius varieornatus]
MDAVNPMNVLKLLEVDYRQTFQLDDALTSNFNLLSAPDEAEFDDNLTTEPPSSGTEPSSHELFVPKIPDPRAEPSQMIDLDYKKRSVAFWKNATSKKRRSLTAVQYRFTRVTSVRQLQDWEKHVETGGSRMDKLKALRLETGKQFFLAKKKKKHVVKDLDLRRWALTANQAVGLEGFKASPDWVEKLKRYYSICDRKITKFVTEKSIKKLPKVRQSAADCVALVRLRIADYGLDCLWNADQSGFEYEMKPGRTLDICGVKHVEAITQSENSMTHSYTVMMTVSPGTRKFLPKLFLTLQEPKGVFGPIVTRTMFKAENWYVTALTSGKMAKKLYLEWCAEVFFPHMVDRCIQLADSWTTFNDQDSVMELKPDNVEYEMHRIPLKVIGGAAAAATMKFLVVLSVLVAVASAGSLHRVRRANGDQNPKVCDTLDKRRGKSPLATDQIQELPNPDRTTPLCRRFRSPTLTALRSSSLVSTLMTAAAARSSIDLFNQITLVCDWFWNVDCSQSKQFQDSSNSRLYTEGNVLLDNQDDYELQAATGAVQSSRSRTSSKSSSVKKQSRVDSSESSDQVDQASGSDAVEEPFQAQLE